MKYLAAYLLAQVAGTESPSAADIKKILSAVGIEVDNEQVEKVISALSGKKIILFDDVANTGRTIFYACKPFLNIIPERLEIAALVDRKHKLFPIQVDYVGLSLATTLHNNIEVIFNDDKTTEAYLS